MYIHTNSYIVYLGCGVQRNNSEPDIDSMPPPSTAAPPLGHFFYPKDKYPLYWDRPGIFTNVAHFH